MALRRPADPTRTGRPYKDPQKYPEKYPQSAPPAWLDLPRNLWDVLGNLLDLFKTPFFYGTFLAPQPRGASRRSRGCATQDPTTIRSEATQDPPTDCPSLPLMKHKPPAVRGRRPSVCLSVWLVWLCLSGSALSVWLWLWLALAVWPGSGLSLWLLLPS